jgi:uncharacterized protein YbjQ (UPF0145 family)
MKVSEIAKKYGLNADDFEIWLNDTGHKVKFGFTGSTVDDSLNSNDLATNYKQALAQKKEQLDQKKDLLNKEKEAAAIAEREKQQAMASMLITSGFNFDGYTITKYSGYISGDSAIEMDRPSQSWTGGVNKEVAGGLLSSIAKIRRRALAELKEAAYDLGCNAVIGVDFDYLTMDPETATSGGGTLYLPFLFAVTANGNAVIIEKN